MFGMNWAERMVYSEEPDGPAPGAYELAKDLTKVKFMIIRCKKLKDLLIFGLIMLNRKPTVLVFCNQKRAAFLKVLPAYERAPILAQVRICANNFFME